MPSTISGELQVVTAADLGGLGANTGPAVAYQWQRPSLMPSLLPWLALLGMLGLKRNRSGQTWWIWVPLGVVFGIAWMLQMFDSREPEFIADTCSMAVALASGVAAVWLLAPYLNRGNRLPTLLRILVVLTGFSLLAFALPHDWERASMEDFIRGAVTATFAAGFGLVVFLAGFSCRRRYTPLRFLLAVVGWLGLLCLSVVVGIAVFDRHLHVDAVLTMWIVMFAVCCILLLPFLILSSDNAYYRERMVQLLHMRPAISPVIPNQEPNVLNETGPAASEPQSK